MANPLLQQLLPQSYVDTNGRVGMQNDRWNPARLQGALGNPMGTADVPGLHQLAGIPMPGNDVPPSPPTPPVQSPGGPNLFNLIGEAMKVSQSPIGGGPGEVPPLASPPSMGATMQPQKSPQMAAIEASNRRMQNGTPLMPGVLNDNGMPDMSNDPVVKRIQDMAPQMRAAEGQKMSALGGMLGLPTPGPGIVANAPRAPHQPSLGTGSIDSGMSMMDQLKAAAQLQQDQMASGRMAGFDAENMRYAHGNMLDPQNPSEAWQMGQMLNSGRSMSPADVNGSMEAKRQSWNEGHPGVPWNDKTQSVAIANKTQGADKLPFTTDQLEKQKRAQGLTSIDAGKSRFGGAYDAVINNAVNQRDARKARMGEGGQAALSRMMGVDPTNGNPVDRVAGNPMQEVMRMGAMFGPAAAIQGMRNQAEFNGQGIDAAAAHQQNILGAANSIMSNNPGMTFDEAYKQASATLGAGPQLGPQMPQRGPQMGPPAPGGQFNVPVGPGAVGSTPTQPQGVNPQKAQTRIAGLFGTPERPGPLHGVIPPNATYQDVADYLQRVDGTDAEPDEATMEAINQYVEARKGTDPKFMPAKDSEFGGNAPSGVRGMVGGQKGKRKEAYKETVNRRKERRAANSNEAAGYSGGFFGG